MAPHATLQQVETLARRFLEEVADLLRVDLADLQLDRRRSRPTGRERHLWLVEFQQTHAGLPIEGARVFLRISHGRIVQFGTEGIADVELETTPWISREDVPRLASAALSAAPGDLETVAPATLSVLPVIVDEPQALPHGGSPYRHVLAWEVAVRRLQDGVIFRLRIDAHRGELLQVSDPRVFGQASARVHGAWATAPTSQPLAELLVEHQGFRLTDDAGFFDYLGGEASAGLAGTSIQVSDACGPTYLTSWDGVLDFGGTPGSDCSVPANGGPGNTQAARDAYYYLTRGYRAVRGRFPTHSLPGTLIARTNQPNMSCEAYWDESQGSFAFGQAGQGCVNSGEVPGILLHELGHATDSLLGGTAPEGASGEAQADFFAFLQTADTCIGRGLRPNNPCWNCDDLCTGVRDLAAFIEGGTAPVAKPGTLEAPDGLACDRFHCPYPGGAAFQGPLGYQAHCESQIASSAMLDLYHQLLAVRQQAGRQTLEDLWFTALPALGQAYRRVSAWPLCQAQDEAADGCGASNWYSVLLAADDDDGNLANGTPNGCLIWQAFNTHGIACGSSPACSCAGGGSVANAGPDRTICRGEQVTLGGPGVWGGGPKTFTWLPGEQTTVQIQVSPEYTTDYTLTATDSCGETQDQVTVTVTACDGFEEDFESGVPGWTTSGLWHAVEGTGCVEPPAAAGTGAMYYGIDGACTVDNGEPGAGDLISPPILISSEKQVLSFDFYLADSAPEVAWGRAELAVRIAGATAWEPRWAVRITDLVGGAWQTSPAISLTRYLGETLQLRFRFEAYGPQGKPNEYLGWLIDDVRVFEGHPPDAGTAPAVTLIEAPTEPLSQCECVRCRFAVDDADDGDLSEILAWSSDLDGALGSAGRPALILSPGEHQLTGTVIDYDGKSASLTIPLVVLDEHDDCELPRWPPAEPRLYCGDEEDD
ncbi:MAG: hypothetical protein AAF657_34765 [Acidobacteriota bacterium]